MTLLTSWESLRELSAMQERMNRMNVSVRATQERCDRSDLFAMQKE